MQRLVRGLRDAGVPLLVGTEPFVPCVVPGFSMKNEFEQLYGAGITPAQILQAATSNAARFLGISGVTGTIEAGKTADLVLLDADPLANVDNAFRQDGVMLHGHWFTEDAVQRDLQQALQASKIPGD
jgi:imidazolonepropionase-like amidohydrolase